MIGTRPLTDSECSAILKALSNPRDRLLFTLGLKTGFRIGELLSIRLSDLYEYDRSIKGQISIQKRHTKGKVATRSVPLSKETIATLSTYLKTLPAGQVYLFESRERGPLSRVQAWRSIKTAAQRAALLGKIGCHSTRKTVARKAWESSGKDLVVVQKILGHKSIQSTISYLSVGDEELGKVWESIQKERKTDL